MKTSTYNEFIGQYTNVFENSDFCEFLIDQFEGMNNLNNGVVVNRLEGEGSNELTKSDRHCFLNMTPMTALFDGENPNFWINRALQEMCDDYLKPFLQEKEEYITSDQGFKFITK